MAEETTTFLQMRLWDWRQFKDVQIDFHPRLTVLTGANAAGKTTILNLLSQHFGWSPQLVGTPARKRRGGILSYLSGWRRKNRSSDPNWHQIGSISYANGGEATISVPTELGSASFNASVQGMIAVPGAFIPSHRPVSIYQPIGQIPTTMPTRQQLFENYLGEIRVRYTGGHSGYSPTYRLKEALVSLATFGYGNQVVERNPEAIELFEGFQEILRLTLPSTLGFRKLSVRLPEIVLETDSGDFSFDAVSGGLASIIDLAWQVFMRSKIDTSFVVLIDEPENHLHPELQRTLFPGFSNAFPKVQFVAATHNPFIVGSVQESNVYALVYDSEGLVEGQLLDTANKAGSSNEILRDVLGMSFTIPLWVENRLQGLMREYGAGQLEPEVFLRIREELETLGLSDLFPTALNQLLETQNDSTHES